MKQQLKTLSLSLLFVYLFYTICRLFFYLIYKDLVVSESFLEIIYAFWVGLCFDSIAIFYSNILWIFLCVIPYPIWKWKTIKNISIGIFIITNSFFLSLNVIDLAYFQFAQRRSGWDIIDLISASKLVVIDYLFDFWYASLLFLFIVIGLWIAIKSVVSRIEKPFNFSYYHLFVSLLILGISFIGMRGGFFKRPLFTHDAGKFIKGQWIAFVTNTPHQLISTAETKQTQIENRLSEDKQKELINPYQYPQNNMKMQRKNVVIIILESFDKEYIGYYNPKRKYTPFLDSLITQSISFDESYANGTASMEAPPAIFASIPSLMEDRYIKSKYSTNKTTNIGDLLSKKGYNTSFYHGGANGTMNFDAFIGASNFGTYFGENEYPNSKDHDGNWGIYDEPYLQYFAQQLNYTPQPFLSSVFTLSSHHPYQIPKQYQKILPKGEHPVYQSIAYTDLALKKFFDTAKKMEWFDNTLFVITADHTSVTKDDEYKNFKGQYCVPIIFYQEGIKPQRIKNTIIQHKDIAPTVLSYLHYPDQYFSLGNNAFDSTQNHFAIMFQNNQYTMLKDDFLLTYDRNEVQISNLTNDSIPNESITNEMKDFFFAYLQTYQTRILNNKMY